MVRKAEIVQSQLMIITAAFRTLLSDENFGTLLRAEGLETMPAAISDSIQGEGL
jgi:ParB family chromosome partitioning protein